MRASRTPSSPSTPARWWSRGAALVPHASSAKNPITLLDYGAGNIRSIKNAIRKLGYDIREVQSIKDIESASKLVFPGVGAFGQAMDVLKKKGYDEALREYIVNQDKPFFGICIGMQVLFEGSEEDGGSEGLGIIPGVVGKFHQGAADIQVRCVMCVISVCVCVLYVCVC